MVCHLVKIICYNHIARYVGRVNSEHARWPASPRHSSQLINMVDEIACLLNASDADLERISALINDFWENDNETWNATQTQNELIKWSQANETHIQVRSWYASELLKICKISGNY